MPIRCFQRRAGIKPHVRIISNKRIIVEPRIFGRIGDDEQSVGLKDAMRAEGYVARRLGGVHPNT